MQVRHPRKTPCRSDIPIVFPSSHACRGNHFHSIYSSRVITEVTDKKTDAKNAASAGAGERSGLTRKSTAINDVVESSAATMME